MLVATAEDVVIRLSASPSPGCDYTSARHVDDDADESGEPVRVIVLDLGRGAAIPVTSTTDSFRSLMTMLMPSSFFL